MATCPRANIPSAPLELPSALPLNTICICCTIIVFSGSVQVALLPNTQVLVQFVSEVEAGGQLTLFVHNM